MRRLKSLVSRDGESHFKRLDSQEPFESEKHDPKFTTQISQELYDGDMKDAESGVQKNQVPTLVPTRHRYCFNKWIYVLITTLLVSLLVSVLIFN